MSSDRIPTTGYKTPFELSADIWSAAAQAMEQVGEGTQVASVMADVDVGETPSEVIYRENKLTLHKYEPEGDTEQDVPILVVYALINRPYILDLQPDRSVIRQLQRAGFTTYLIDWGEPSRLDTTLGLDDYVLRYIDNCVDQVKDDASVDTVNILGYCMGGTMSAMYAALRPEKVNALGLMAAGLCFDDTGGVLELWGDESYYDPEAVTDTFGNVPSDFLDYGFALMDPIDNFVTKYVHLADNLDNEDLVENFARMERWLSDGIDVAGRAYVQFLRWLYQGNLLYHNELELDGEAVDIERIEMPVLQIIGEYDHLIPPDSSKPFTEVIPSDDTAIMEFSTGHIGLSVSGRSHAELWPSVMEWYEERSNGISLESIEGIGPTYAERLRGAGIDSVAALARADAASLADAADIPEGRLTPLIEQARQLT